MDKMKFESPDMVNYSAKKGHCKETTPGVG